MSLKKLFSSFTLFGVFLIGATLIVGMVNSENFIYIFTPFIVIISILIFLLVKDLLENISDKVLLGILLILIAFAFTFTASGFKDYSDALQNNNPTIKAQLAQNDELLNNNNYNLQIAQSMQSALNQYELNSVELNKQLNTLIAKQDLINEENAAYIRPVIEEIIYEEPIAEPVYGPVIYDDDRYEDDD